MHKITNNLDQAIARLKQLLRNAVKHKSDSELLEALLSKGEWDEQYYEIVKSEIKYRSNR